MGLLKKRSGKMNKEECKFDNFCYGKYSFEGRAAKEEMMKSHLPNKVPC